MQASRFVREGRVGCKLRHPNIVPIYEVVSERKIHFIVMEFVEGWNLREFVRIRKKFDPAEATRLMIGITDGLRYAFEHGMTHRDLKLSNILVSSRGEAKLVDFGLAAMDEALTDDALMNLPNTRTIDYAALERAHRRAERRHAQRHLFPRLHLLPHADRPAAVARNPRPDCNGSASSGSWTWCRSKSSPGRCPACVTLVVNRAMTLDPDEALSVPLGHAGRPADCRETPGRRAIRRGGSGRTGKHRHPSPSAPATAPLVPDTGRTVMVVEGNADMQDLFRDTLKRAGYRVLIIADPVRAVNRCLQDPTAADCVVFDAQLIGQAGRGVFQSVGRRAGNPVDPGRIAAGRTATADGRTRPASPHTDWCSGCRST